MVIGTMITWRSFPSDRFVRAIKKPGRLGPEQLAGVNRRQRVVGVWLGGLWLKVAISPFSRSKRSVCDPRRRPEAPIGSESEGHM